MCEKSVFDNFIASYNASKFNVRLGGCTWIGKFAIVNLCIYMLFPLAFVNVYTLLIFTFSILWGLLSFFRLLFTLDSALLYVIIACLHIRIIFSCTFCFTYCFVAMCTMYKFCIYCAYCVVYLAIIRSA